MQISASDQPEATVSEKKKWLKHMQEPSETPGACLHEGYTSVKTALDASIQDILALYPCYTDADGYKLRDHPSRTYWHCIHATQMQMGYIWVSTIWFVLFFLGAHVTAQWRRFYIRISIWKLRFPMFQRKLRMQLCISFQLCSRLNWWQPRNGKRGGGSQVYLK